MKLKKSIVSDSVKRALLEDGYTCDLSLKAKNINPKNILKASLISRENGILSGSLWFEESFKQIDKKAKIKWSITEGEAFKKDNIIAEINASSQSILSGERTALNFLQMMSGIAYKTHCFQKELVDSETVLLDTRKTIPGLRYEQKYSVVIGGGQNHRMGLYDAALIKENHISSVTILYTL